MGRIIKGFIVAQCESFHQIIFESRARKDWLKLHNALGFPFFEGLFDSLRRLVLKLLTHETIHARGGVPEVEHTYRF